MSDRVSQLSEHEQVARHRSEQAAPATERPRQHPLVSLQGNVGNAAVARMIQRAAEEEELQGKHDVQRAAEEEELQGKHNPAPQVGLEGGAVPGDLSERINSARGSGSTLDDGLKSKMESGFGTDFSDVKIHRDAEADSLNRSITAKAFTTGNDIFLRNDVTPSDQHTIAHELTHVVQQRSGAINNGPGMTVGAADHSSEAEADATASAVLAGNVQRHGDDEHV